VTDCSNHRIQIFDENGKFILKFGEKGESEGELNEPIGIALNSKKQIIVSEYANNHLQVFYLNGNHIKFIGVDILKKPNLICLDLDDNIYVANQLIGDETKIHVFHYESGELIHSFGQGALNGPMGMGFDASSHKIFVSNWDNHNICVF